MAASTPGDQESRLDAQRVLAATRELPDDQRMAVLLVGIEEMSYQEAADMLGIPVGTLMSRLHRGRERLRRRLGMAGSGPALHRVK
jgi:RNA polymerase sigma-70 factor (ECF subfamily)